MELNSEILKVNRQKILNSFPFELKNDVEAVIDFLFHEKFKIHPDYDQEIILDSEKIIIPGRVYFDELNETHSLSELQQTILNCIYLRHHNGFIRHRKLELLVNKTEYFVVPYVFKLLGEYVVEILYVVDKHINDKTIENYLKFISENKKYWQQTESRMISYWNENYRSQPKYNKLNDYIGKQIVDKIKKSQRAMNM